MPNEPSGQKFPTSLNGGSTKEKVHHQRDERSKEARTDVLPIWSVGLAASLGKRLPKQHVQREGNTCVMMIIICKVDFAIKDLQ